MRNHLKQLKLQSRNVSVFIPSSAKHKKIIFFILGFRWHRKVN